MAQLTQNPDRLKAVIGVAAFHALLGYALISGLGYQVARDVSENLKVFDVSEPPPPPPEEEPAPKERTKEPEGAAAPPSIKAIVAPPPKIRLPVPPPVQTAPASGNADIVGTGTGSGGTGTGTGSGGSGTGTGGGGGGTKARRIRGGLDYMDLPRAARQRGAQGSVGVRFVVQPDGRVTGCSVVESSRDAVLDSTTCAMIERRFRYRPAEDANGRRIPETVTTVFTWIPTGR